MAALLTFVKVARSVRDSARAAAELLPRSLSEPLLRQERELNSFLEEIGVGLSVPPRQAEAMLSSLYARLEAIEARIGPRRLSTVVQRRAVSALRSAVVDLELLLVPDRERDFALLGVTRDDDVTWVKSRFRALARKHHPDVSGGDTRRMEELNRAYKTVLRMQGARVPPGRA